MKIWRKKKKKKKNVFLRWCRSSRVVDVSDALFILIYTLSLQSSCFSSFPHTVCSCPITELSESSRRDDVARKRDFGKFLQASGGTEKQLRLETVKQSHFEAKIEQMEQILRVLDELNKNCM